MEFWTVLGAIASLVAAIGVTIQLTVAAATRGHGSVGVAIAPLPQSEGGGYLIGVSALGQLVMTEPKAAAPQPALVEFPMGTPHVDSRSAPFQVRFTMPEGNHAPFPALVITWIRATGFRPRPGGLMLGLSEDRSVVLHLTRSNVWPWRFVWKARKQIKFPKAVHRAATTY